MINNCESKERLLMQYDYIIFIFRVSGALQQELEQKFYLLTCLITVSCDFFVVLSVPDTDW
jgi:hypothetical protein